MILNTVLAAELVDYDVRKVVPSEYKLFQVADLFCMYTSRHHTHGTKLPKRGTPKFKIDYIKER